ncbi:MAG: ATP-dependent helicase [Sulfolobales archaeon]|nr:ATP-dependent helicase [Sulfolobales archaeon]MCX8208034.1 ATP-dependent helicase [Sulfolobales archaeon]MDW8010209.1 ATP-dependent helicase [Sulfolobales archaeon]
MEGCAVVKVVAEVPREDEVLSLLREYTVAWFKRTFRSFTPSQLMAIPYIKQGLNVLISSPTGTGKTLAAFLPIVDGLYRLGELGQIQDSVYAVYISPLRALNNDIVKNLRKPIDGIREVALGMGIELPELRVKVRTSDTLPSEKQKMLKEPPHILVTTPESLAIALVAPRFREKLSGVRWVVVDEVHELASSKRGAHLSLTLERLEELIPWELQRIGLSATIAPLEVVAQFLVGYRSSLEPRDCVVVDARFLKPMEVDVLCPKVDIIRDSAEVVNEAIYQELKKIVLRHRTTLVFTNTRSSTERVVFKLRKIFEKEGVLDADEVEAHHSSLSRELRLDVENKLKNGDLRAIVSSTSLELGVDIGHIDAVVLLSSPKSVTRLIQRVGRSGHSISDVSRGYIVAVDRDDLVEVTVLAKLSRERKLDSVRVLRKPLDILAQHIVGMSLERKWKLREAYEVIRRSYNYRELSWGEFMRVIEYLSGKHEDVLLTTRTYSKIRYYEDEEAFGKKRGVRAIYYLNSGAIPDEAKIRVFTEDGRYVGDLEEEFVEYLEPGDVFVLGGRTFQFVKSSAMRVVARKVEHQKPTVPSWFSEMLPLSFDSAIEVAKFRGHVSRMIDSVGLKRAVREVSIGYGVDERVAKYIVDYVYEQKEYVGVVPDERVFLVEMWYDDASYTDNLIFHTLLGRRVNDALARATALLASDLIDVNVRITVTDNGFILTAPSKHVLFNDEVVHRVLSDLKNCQLRELLRRALRRSEILKRRFRHCAERALALLRNYRGEETSVSRRQVNAETLIRIVETIEEFPILEEAYREVMEDVMDVEDAERILNSMKAGDIMVKLMRVRGPPSPFAHSMVTHGYSDVILMEDRKKLLLKLYEEVLRKMSEKVT